MPIGPDLESSQTKAASDPNELKYVRHTLDLESSLTMHNVTQHLGRCP